MSNFFSGFEIPNTTPVPDVVFDELLEKLTGNELKVLLYIIRRTYGFGKNADAISLSQFREGITTHEGKILDKGCGIKHNRTILVALTSLEENGCVASKKRQTKAGDQDTTVYGLRFKKANKPAPSESSDEGVVTSSNHVVTSSNEGGYSTSPRSLPQVTTVVTSGNQQETVLQQTDSQETGKQEESITGNNSQTPNSSPDGDILSQENTLLQEQLAKRDEQIALLLAQVTQLSTKVAELSTSSTQDNQPSTQANEQPAYSQEATKKPEQQSLLEKPSTPEMPSTSVRWCPEIAVQIVEAKLGKYYRQVARDKELSFAKRMFREDPELTRKQFEDAYDKRNDKWWHDHKGLLHLHHMVEKDRIHEMLDKIEVDSIGNYQGNNRILNFPATQPQPQKQLVTAGTGFFTEGPLAGQPDYHADPWA